jgi:hypothetical protein
LRWLWLRSRKVCPQWSLLAWHWVQDGWRNRRLLFVNCRRCRRLDALQWFVLIRRAL